MTPSKTQLRHDRRSMPGLAVRGLALALLAFGLAGCKHDGENGEVMGWMLIDPAQRHPILVSQQPSTLSLRVGSRSGRLTPQQRAELLAFAGHYRAGDAGDSRLVISAPGGSANEMAAMHAVREIRALLADNGFQDASISVEAYHAEREKEPPVRVSYLRYVATPPPCGVWPTNLAREPQNLPAANIGCATQRNFAAMVANPADLLGPRSEGGRSSERRGETWDKYIKGESTGARKSEDERVKVKSE